MPRAKPKFGIDWTKAQTRPLTLDERERVQKVCPNPEFLRAIEYLARLYRNLRRLGDPTAREMIATLDELDRLVVELRSKLSSMPLRVNVLLCTDNPSFLDDAIGSLAPLAQAIRHAKAHAEKPSPGREVDAIGRDAAQALRILFEEHSIEFASTDSRHKAATTASASCLRIILGLSESASVSRLLK